MPHNHIIFPPTPTFEGIDSSNDPAGPFTTLTVNLRLNGARKALQIKIAHGIPSSHAAASIISLGRLIIRESRCPLSSSSPPSSLPLSSSSPSTSLANPKLHTSMPSQSSSRKPSPKPSKSEPINSPPPLNPAQHSTVAKPKPTKGAAIKPK
jgi:hypothetical protein